MAHIHNTALERTCSLPLLAKSSMDEDDSYGGERGDVTPLIRRAFGTGRGLLRSMTTLTGREETLVRGSNVERAAVIVDQAIDGEPIPVEVLREDRCRVAVWAFLLHHKMRGLWSVALTGLVLLLFFEVPPWCRFKGENPCGDPVKYPRGNLPHLSRFWVAITQGLCVLILAIKHWLCVEFYGVYKATHDFVQISKVILLVALVSDSTLLLLFPFSRQTAAVYYLRIATVITFSRALRETFMGLVNIIGKFVDFMVLVLVYVLIASWFAVLLFHKTPEGTVWYPTYVSTLYHMFLLLTGCNLPDIEIPAYRESRLSCIFFVIYLVLGFFVLMNILLAVIYESYKHQVALKMLQEAELRREDLEIAFRLLDEEGRGWIDDIKVFGLLLALNRYRKVRCIQGGKIHPCVEKRGRDRNFKMEKDEFLGLCNLIGSNFTRLDEKHFLETRFPQWFRSPCFQALVTFVNKWHFSACVNTMVLVNAFVLLIEGRYYIADDSRQKFWFKFLIIFGLLYVVEMVLKVLGRGWTRYWMGYLSRFDFIITWCIVAVFIAQLVRGPFRHVNVCWIRYLEILRVSRLVSVLGYFERYKIIMRTFIRLIPTLAPLTGVLFFVLLIFCSIGIQGFGGLIYVGNPDLQGTVYLTRNYTVMNFNDFASGMMILFDLCLMSNWVGYMETFVKVSRSAWSRLFFFSFYVVVVMFMLNLAVAFVLQAFLTQMKYEEAERKKRKCVLVQAGTTPDGNTRAVDGTASATERDEIGIPQSWSTLKMLEEMFSTELQQARMNHPGSAPLSRSSSRIPKAGEDCSSSSSKSEDVGGRSDGRREGLLSEFFYVTAKLPKLSVDEGTSSGHQRLASRP